MTFVNVAIKPIERYIELNWWAWIPMLQNGAYGLMMVHNPHRKSKKRNIVIKAEFESTDEAFSYAEKWLEENRDKY